VSHSDASTSVYIHPLAIVETNRVGAGTRIWGWSHIQEDVVVGEGCNIGEHCFIENGVEIGSRVVVKNGISLWNGIKIADDAFLGPHAVFTNERFPRSGFPKQYEPIIIEHGASIGAGAVIVPGVKIGTYATVGAGAVVTKNVLGHTLVIGNPARWQAWMCICGLRLHPGAIKDYTECKCGRRYLVTDGICSLVK
jgi:acetyltransferase-like isoleucine patch superfamily enzyme